MSEVWTEERVVTFCKKVDTLMPGGKQYPHVSDHLVEVKHLVASHEALRAENERLRELLKKGMVVTGRHYAGCTCPPCTWAEEARAELDSP